MRAKLYSEPEGLHRCICYSSRVPLVHLLPIQVKSKRMLSHGPMSCQGSRNKQCRMDQQAGLKA